MEYSEIQVGGVYKMRMPIQYLVEDATKKNKELFEMYKSQVEKIIKEGEGFIVLPSLTDDHGNYLFDLVRI